MTMQAEAGFSGNAVLLRALRQNRWTVGLVLVHALATALVAARFHLAYDTGAFAAVGLLMAVLAPAFAMIIVLWRVVHMIRFVRPKRPLPWLIRDIRAIILERDRFYGALISIPAVVLFCANFTFLKSAIPVINPFGWDQFFSDADRMLLGGHDAYTFFLPLATPLITTAINAAYNVWLLVIFFMAFFACLSVEDMRARNTFLIAFVLTWGVGGNLIATIFSSAGPVYFAMLGLGHRLAPLMSTLHAFDKVSPVWSLQVQGMLWDGYIGRGPISGISAFPSMHLATSVVMALYGYRLSRGVGIALTVFATMIALGTVLLAWHYAIGSAAGALIGVACWKIGGRLAAHDEDQITAKYLGAAM